MNSRRIPVVAVMITAVALVGCAQVKPDPPAGSVTVASPSASAEPAAFEIGTDGTATGNLVAAVYRSAVEASGLASTVVPVTPGTEVAALGEGAPEVMPVFAGTLLVELQHPVVPTETSDLVTELATAVAPQVSVLQSTEVDGGWVWAVTSAVSQSGVSDLSSLSAWGPDKSVVAPKAAFDSAAGVPALKVAYGSLASARQVDDPAARRAALEDGSALAGVFRRTEVAALAGLTQLPDPVGVSAPDPLVALVTTQAADDEPDAVLAIAAVQQALTNDVLADLAAKAGTGDPAAVIDQWLETTDLLHGSG